MVYESSYESGRKPFIPDTSRGYWAQPNDFILTSMGLAFKLDFFYADMKQFISAGIAVVIPYFICFGLYVVPLMVIHSFMGQFSSSGYISAFRVSPFFRGIGYISLAINFSVLTYYSVFVTVSMIYMFNSFKPTLPWSCEVFEHKPDSRDVEICNGTRNPAAVVSPFFHVIPAVGFFQSHFDVKHYREFGFSWELFICTLLTWALIAAILYKYFKVTEIGKLLRYGILTTLALLIICNIRFMFLPGASKSLKNYFAPKKFYISRSIENVLVYSMSAFGPGWGSIISLSSHNKFNRNIMRDSWIISIGQMLITMLFHFNVMLVSGYYSEITNKSHYKYYNYIGGHWSLYMSSASAIATMRFANFWSLIFYTMLTLSALIVMVTQLYTLLVSIFDEFVYLRAYKMKVTFIMIGVLAFFSLHVCTNKGIEFFSALPSDTVFTQTALNLMLLLIVLWVYGRERFQRDIAFMLGQRFATWKVNMLRFVSPLLLLFFAFCDYCFPLLRQKAALWSIEVEHIYTSTYTQVMVVIFIILPWFSVPVYGLFILLKAQGSWLIRFKRSCRPNDWYPVEQENRQRYEVAMGNENITHHLNELGEEVL